MELKRRMNAVYRDYPPYRTGELVGVVTGNNEPDLRRWLGTIDRRAAKLMPSARQVALDFEAYRLSLLDKTVWLKPNVRVVGCLTPDGEVLAVTDGNKPLLKKFGNYSTESSGNS